MTKPLRQAVLLLTAFAVLLSLTGARKWNSGYFTTTVGVFNPTRFDPWNMKVEGKLVRPDLLPRSKIGEVLLFNIPQGEELNKQVTFVPLSTMEPKPSYVPIAEFGPDFKWRSVIKKGPTTPDKTNSKALVTIGYLDEANSDGEGIQVQVPNTLGKNHFNARLMTPEDRNSASEYYKRGLLSRLFSRKGVSAKKGPGPGAGYRFTFDAVPLFLPKGCGNSNKLHEKLQALRRPVALASQCHHDAGLDDQLNRLIFWVNAYLKPAVALDKKAKKTYCNALLYDDIFLALVYPGTENRKYMRTRMHFENFGWRDWFQPAQKVALHKPLRDYLNKVQTEVKETCRLSKSKRKTSVYNLKAWGLLEK